MTRESGRLMWDGTIRIARDNVIVPSETREHDGAGIVTWVLIDGEWRIFKAEGTK